MKTPHDHRQLTDERRKAYKREEIFVDVLAWGIIVLIIICVLL